MLTTKKAIGLSKFCIARTTLGCAMALVALAGCSGGGAGSEPIASAQTSSELPPVGPPPVAPPPEPEPPPEPAPTPPPAPPPNQNHPPEISGVPPPSAQAGQTYSFAPTASDADNDALVFSGVNIPAWAQFSTVTGALTGTPGDADVGESPDITISVSDGRDSRSIGPFRIQVQARNAPPQPGNRPPTISGAPASSATVNQTYSFTPSAADADRDSLRFTISNRPSWASFNTTSGRFSGTPTSANVGRYANIVISVTDGRASASLPAFAIEVRAAANRPPTLSGAPPTSVTAGLRYEFRPNAADADGDTLTFSIQNRPSWASFDASTGRLSGAPTSADVGSYANVAIEVSDGAARASLPTFAIAVEPASLGSAVLSWSAPTQNTDGSALTDLAGFVIRYGSAPSSLDESIEITTPGLATYVISEIESGTWYFTVEAYNANGARSAPSRVVSKTVP